METLSYLDNVRRETARILRVTLEHYRANSPGSSTKDLLERIVREQAFTVLNRLAALRMAEAREFITESIAKGYESRGFQLYLRLAGTGLGETGDAYRSYLFSLFDEFALDLRVLFDRFSPMGRLFPSEPKLLDLLKLMNDPEVADLWAEDETIGWIYQYFNSKDERKKMRDESAAPRNSRELAVRNQFFTPRYVVEFLTDNTLGRIWYEMTQGETALKDRCRYLVRRPTEIFLQEGAAAPESPEVEASLSQEELLKQPVYIPHRSLKDPREIRMLDPACGSMHFGLYAFDLYECIYEEAWDLEERGIPFQRCAGRELLTATYASKEAFLRDVPRLIIEHNIHGVDIDPRAVQIAGLSLWLRAQKSWQAQELKLSARPQIQKSNVVCAEPMPGEERLLNEFLEQHLTDTPEQKLVGQLVRRVFEAMKLAGEAGSLLQIEQDIASEEPVSQSEYTPTKILRFSRVTSGITAEELVEALNQEFSHGKELGYTEHQISVAIDKYLVKLLEKFHNDLERQHFINVYWMILRACQNELQEPIAKIYRYLQRLGLIEVVTGQVKEVIFDGKDIIIDFKNRELLKVNFVVNATGIDHSYEELIRQNTLLKNLEKRGYISPHKRTNLGLEVNDSYEIVSNRGLPMRRIYPLGRLVEGESIYRRFGPYFTGNTGIRGIRNMCSRLASIIFKELEETHT